MKKIAILFAGAAIAVSLVSCGGYCPQKIENENDSLNYAFGAANGNGIKQYVLGGDTSDASARALIRGIKKGMKTNDTESKMYAEGLKIGITLKEQLEKGLAGESGVEAKDKIVLQALIQAIQGDTTALFNGQQAYEYFMKVMQKLDEQKRAAEAAEKAAQYEENKTAGEEFLFENAKKESVTVTSTGLQYEILKNGKGAKPTETDRVKVHYHGTLIDGTVFDSSVERGTPAEFGVNQVIAGWTEALQLMPVGSKWKLYIPQQLAYGDADQGTIKPYSTLIFEVELLEIVK